MRHFSITFLALSLCLASFAITPKSDIPAIVDRHRPLNGGLIPKDISDRLGVTHVGGKYYLTDEPFIIEGSRKIQELGFTTTKYFIGKPNNEGQLGGYIFNSNWNLPKDGTLIDVLSHPYVDTAFNCGQKRIVMNIGTMSGRVEKENPDFSVDKQELKEAAKFLLNKYKDREITFIIKNWEGDWMLRGLGTKKNEWMDASQDQVREIRVKNMTAWFTARQEAITEARAEVKKTKAKIYFAVEANKVIESMNGVTGIASDILPNIEIDMVSWSSYDGMNDYTNLYQGIEYLREQLRPSKYMNGRKEVFIGEIGIAERLTKETPTKRWDYLFGVLFALDVPLVIDWELYCNEIPRPSGGPDFVAQKDFSRKRSAEELMGLWMIKPDGSKSETCLFWQSLLQNGGKKITDSKE